MRAVFVGAGSLSVMSVQLLLKRGHEVVIVERDKSIIDALSENLDAGFLHGDGSKPAILREADPEQTDVLFCLTGNDQANILASLVGRSLGFKRVVTKIEDPEFEYICLELGLEETIVPSRTIARHLADMFEGRDPLELLAMIRGDARAFSFIARKSEAGLAVNELDLPDTSRIVCLYRDEETILPTGDTKLKDGDQVVIIAHRKDIETLQERWIPHSA